MCFIHPQSEPSLFLNTLSYMSSVYRFTVGVIETDFIHLLNGEIVFLFKWTLAKGIREGHYALF